VELADEMRVFVPVGLTMVQMALRWILDHPEVSVVIPGASSVEQVRQNVSASGLPRLTPQLHERLSQYYRTQVAPFIRGPY
jgi:aryl-alcohol dehydrogenase-like predicted oxidoreductase